MRKLGRCMLNGLTVLSLLVCVATIFLWVRSYSEGFLFLERPLPPIPSYSIATHSVFAMNGFISSRDMWTEGVFVGAVKENWSIPIYAIVIVTGIGSYPL